MQTLTEFLKLEENQKSVLGYIVDLLIVYGDWGKHGLFAKIGLEIGFSSAFVGRVLNGKKPLTASFVEKMASYLGVSLSGLGVPPRTFTADSLIALGGREEIFKYLIDQGLVEETAHEISDRVISYKEVAVDNNDSEGDSEKTSFGEIVRIERDESARLPTLANVINRCRVDDNFRNNLKKWLNSDE